MAPNDDFTTVATTDELPPGGALGVTIDGIEVAVFNANGEYYAMSNRCSHQQAPLCNAGEEKVNADHTWTKTRGKVNEDECTVTCPWHLWEWDLESGEHEASGQRIGTFDAKAEDGDVLVRI